MAKEKKIFKQEKKETKIEPKKLVCYKTISLQFDDFTQIYQDVDLSECISSETKYLSIKKLIKQLERCYNLSFLNKQVRYFLEDGQLWISCPKLKMNIGELDYQPYPQLKLSALTGKEYIDAIMEQTDSDSDSQNNSEDEELEGEDQKCRRLKQRKIKHVIEKVLKWRQLYAGIGSKDKIPLEQGAKVVNISKKTLDDYLSQIKKGKKYGFNFNEHKNEKIGVLREFIRKIEKTKK